MKRVLPLALPLPKLSSFEELNYIVLISYYDFLSKAYVITFCTC